MICFTFEITILTLFSPLHVTLFSACFKQSVIYDLREWFLKKRDFAKMIFQVVKYDCQDLCLPVTIHCTTKLETQIKLYKCQKWPARPQQVQVHVPLSLRVKFCSSVLLRLNWDWELRMSTKPSRKFWGKIDFLK